MSRSRILLSGRAVALATVLACATAACQTTAAAGPVTTPDPASSAGPQVVRRSSSDAEVAGVIADARTARARGDSQALRRFQARLVEALGQASIAKARADYQRALDDLDAAIARGDSRGRADFRAQLRAICGPHAVASAFETCDSATIVWGR